PRRQGLAQPLLAQLDPLLLPLHRLGPGLSPLADPAQQAVQLVEVEPDAVVGADVDDHPALAAVVAAVHQRAADHAGAVAEGLRSALAPAVPPFAGGAAAEPFRQVARPRPLAQDLEDLLLEPEAAAGRSVEQGHARLPQAPAGERALPRA